MTLEDTGGEVPAAALQQVSLVKANGQGQRGPSQGFGKQARLLHLHLPVCLLLLPSPRGKMTLNASKSASGRRGAQGKQRRARRLRPPSHLPGDRLDEAGAGGLETLRTYLAARQATSEKKKASVSGNVPTEWRQQQHKKKKKERKKEESPLGKGLPAPLCLWRCFWFPASTCGLGMVGALIRHR